MKKFASIIFDVYKILDLQTIKRYVIPFFVLPLLRFAPPVVSPGCDKYERVGGAGRKQDIFQRYPLSFPICEWLI